MISGHVFTLEYTSELEYRKHYMGLTSELLYNVPINVCFML